MAAAIHRVVEDGRLRDRTGRGGRRAGRLVRPAAGPGRVRRRPRGRLRGVTPPRAGDGTPAVRIAFVVPRYGPDIIGGAETAARLLAEHLVALQGWEVDVLTTCAEDFVTWDDVYPPGEESDQRGPGGPVPLGGRPGPSFHPLSAALLADPAGRHRRGRRAVGRPAGTGRPRRWPRRPSAGTATPWSSTPTCTTRRSGSSSGCGAHRSSIRRPTTSPPSTCRSSRGVRRGRRPGVPDGGGTPPGGADVPGGQPPSTAPGAGRGGSGRGDGRPGPGRPGPGSAGPVTGAVRRCPTALPGVPGPGRQPQGHDTAGPLLRPLQGAPPRTAATGAGRPGGGRARRPTRTWTWWARCRRTTSGCSSPAPRPWCRRRRGRRSRWWSPRRGAPVRPVLVNAGCGATVEHCRRSGGGLTFDGYGEFEVAVDRLVGDPAFGATLGGRGRAYVDARFRWPHVIDRYATFVGSVVERARRRSPRGGALTARG